VVQMKVSDQANNRSLTLHMLLNFHAALDRQ
jgi:hypothetical protein